MTQAPSVKGRARVISGADGTQLFYLSPGTVADSLGTSVCSAGDVNSDGYPDFVLGAPRYQGTSRFQGRVYVVSGRDGNTLLASFTGAPRSGMYGITLALLGDVNGDGFPEIAVGATQILPGDKGAVQVIDLQTNSVLYTKKADPQGRFYARTYISSIGDVNGDGVPDLFVGDERDNPASGKAYIYDGPTGDLIWKLSGEAGDGFGGGRSAGDLDGDGYGDMLLASHNVDTVVGRPVACLWRIDL